MLRLLLAALAALSPAAFVVPAFGAGPHASPTGATDAHAAAAHVLTLDASLLPGPTGWFLVPVTASEAADVLLDLDVHVEDLDGAPSPAATVLASPYGVMVDAYAVLGDADVAEVHHGGRALACCGRAAGLSYGGTSSGRGDLPYRLEAGDTLWVGLLAMDWEAGSRATFTLRSDALLEAGAPRQGHRVEMVDLVERAWQAGDNARVAGLQAGDHGLASARFQPQGTGIYHLSYSAMGDARGRLTATLGSEVLMEGRQIAGAFGGVRAARAEALEVTLADVHVDGRPYLGGLDGRDRPSSLEAFVLFADVDAPFDGVLQWDDRWDP